MENLDDVSTGSGSDGGLGGFDDDPLTGVTDGLTDDSVADLSAAVADARGNGVLDCATHHVLSCFTACHVSLFETPQSQDRGSAALLPPMPTHNGLPSLSPKSKVVYDVENPNVPSYRLYLHPSPFSKCSPVLRCFSIYQQFPTDGQLDELGVLTSEVQKQRSNSFAQDAPLATGPATMITARVERVVFHPVSQGCLKQSGVALHRSSTKTAATTAQGTDWNLYWGARWKDEEFPERLRTADQRVNHFPGTWLIGRKDNLARRLQSLSRRCSRVTAFAPTTYLLPADFGLLQRDVALGFTFIAKPPASARGNGIYLFRESLPADLVAQSLSTTATLARKGSGTGPSKEASQRGQPGSEKNREKRSTSAAAAVGRANDVVGEAEAVAATTVAAAATADTDPFIVQRYIPNPLLINGFKVDLRVYVAVTSFDPLRVFIYNEGLVRFATARYDATDLTNVFSHLTNYSVNKKNVDAYRKVDSPEADGGGSKWTLHALQRYFAANGWNWEACWKKVGFVVGATLISCEGPVASKVGSLVRRAATCFELYGFDIMIDSDLEPHLIEVNVMPSLACGSALDKHVKGSLLADLYTLVGVPLRRGASEGMTGSSTTTTAGSGKAGGDGNVAATAGSSNNAALRSVALSAALQQSLRSDANFFATGGAVVDSSKALLREVEGEFARRGGFDRIIPSPSAEEEFGHLFEQRRFNNLLLWRWEKEKASRICADPSRVASVLAWLDDNGPYPSQQNNRKAPPRNAGAAGVPAPSGASERPGARARAPSMPPLPPPNVLKGDSTRGTAVRVSAPGRTPSARTVDRREKVVAAPRPALAALPVSTFHFVQVKKPC